MKSTKAAIKALGNTAKNPSIPLIDGAWQDDHSRWCVCDGYKAYRWVGTDFNLPHVENSYDTLDLEKAIFNCRFNPNVDYQMIRPFTLNVAKIKEALKNKKRSEKVKNPLVKIGFCFFNARWFIDMLYIVGEDAEIYICTSNPYQPVVFVSESCEAAMLPVRVFGDGPLSEVKSVVYEYPAADELAS